MGQYGKYLAINPEKVLSVKYGEINLTNTVNIITSVQKFQDFIDELAGEYVDRNRTKHKKEDKTQGYRRFPVFIEVTKQSLDIYVSQALSDGEYKEYERAMKVEASMIEFAKNNTKENLKKIGEPFVKVHKKVERKNGEELKKEPKELNVKVEISDKFKNFFDDDDIIEGEFTEK